MKYRWSLLHSDPSAISRIHKEVGVSELLARCLVNRGVRDPDSAQLFLNPRLKDVADPMNLPNMEAMVDRLWLARERGERIVVFGDYDVDGVSSTALLLEVFEELGWPLPNVYLPHRLEEGYGLSQKAVETCLTRFSPELLLAVDCGSTAGDTIAWLRNYNVDVLVLDHHQIAEEPPDANAVVNPQINSAEDAPFRELCAAGLAFKLAHALVKRGREENLPEAFSFDLRKLLDLVALGTIADLVPLTGENRVLVSKGLECLKNTKRPGIQALKEIAQIEDRVGVFEVGFQLGPRLNAAGRLENALDALELLRAGEKEEALTLARELDFQNRERQRIEREMAESCVEQVRSKFESERDFVIVEGDLRWHVGVVGIVASRVMRAFYRPSIIIGGEGPEWRGSGRSIDGFDLAAALRECDDLLVRHGGHAMAVGLSVDPKKVDEFRERLNGIAKERISGEQLRPEITLDGESNMRELKLDTVSELSRLQPSGQAAPRVQLAIRNLKHYRPPRRIGAEQRHLKMLLTDGQSVMESIWWSCCDAEPPKGIFDIAAEPTVSEFNGRKQVQLKMMDWRPALGES